MIPQTILALRERYSQAQQKVIASVELARLRGRSIQHQTEIIESIKEEVRVLDEYVKTWSSTEIPKAYDDGIDQAFQSFRKKNIDVTKIAANSRAVRLLVTNMSATLTGVNRFIGRHSIDAVRKGGVDVVTQKVMTGMTIDQAKKVLAKRLAEDGVGTIPDALGRNLNIASYAEMVARTTTREATNQGTILQLEESGNDLVQMSSHFSTCPICAVYEGRVYSVSGKDDRYPPLSSAFPSGYSTIHPNCTHNLMPYVEEMDDHAEATRTMSNRPFRIDPKKQRSIDDYNRAQKTKGVLRQNRAQWERYRELAPDLAPKTLSGYVRMKNANSTKYRELRRVRRVPQPKAPNLVTVGIIPPLGADETISFGGIRYTTTPPSEVLRNVAPGHNVRKLVGKTYDSLDEETLSPVAVKKLLSNSPTMKADKTFVPRVVRAIETYSTDSDSFTNAIFDPTKDNHRMAVDLNTFIDESKKWGENGELFRGLQFHSPEQEEAFFKQAVPGGVITSDNLTSWSSDAFVADEFAGVHGDGKGYAAVLHLPKSYTSTPISFLSEYNDGAGNEKEVLMKSRVPLRVVKTEMRPEGTGKIVDLWVEELVPIPADDLKMRKALAIELADVDQKAAVYKEEKIRALRAAKAAEEERSRRRWEASRRAKETATEIDRQRAVEAQDRAIVEWEKSQREIEFAPQLRRLAEQDLEIENESDPERKRFLLAYRKRDEQDLLERENRRRGGIKYEAEQLFYARLGGFDE